MKKTFSLVIRSLYLMFYRLKFKVIFLKLIPVIANLFEGL